MEHLVEFLQDKPLNERIDTWELEVAKAVEATAGDAGIAPCQVKPISRRTLMRTKKLLDVREGEAEVSTAAQDAALADPRNALSFATTNACCVPMSTPELIINVDATQFTCGDMKARRTKAAFIGPRPSNVKVAARPEMRDQEIDVHEVLGIGAGTSPKETAFIVFSKTRVPQLEFYKWYIRFILVPWVQELREIYGLSTDVPAFFQLDGEAAQIAPFLKDTQIRQLINEHNILVGKPPASTTAINQALDAGPLFMTSKDHLKSTTDGQFAGHWLMARLRAVWDVHRLRIGERPGISDAHRKSAIHGILRIHQCVQRAFHSKAIMQSFKATDEQMHYVKILPALCRLFKKQDVLYESNFDQYEIRTTHVRGQERCVSHRRSVLMSGKGFWAAEVEKERVCPDPE
ncbi:hypothetical protein B484DRAFT_400370 [Ochromonadaceae sp. CCMP2298]|nr:hypothetical protein B484DRAFT_400370 [Ochromonadaceae sp. CCMP2298]